MRLRALVTVEAWEWTPRNTWDEKPTRSKLERP